MSLCPQYNAGACVVSGNAGIEPVSNQAFPKGWFTIHANVDATKHCHRNLLYCVKLRDNPPPRLRVLWTRLKVTHAPAHRPSHVTLHTPSHFTHPHTSHTLTLHIPSHFTHPHTHFYSTVGRTSRQREGEVINVIFHRCGVMSLHLASCFTDKLYTHNREQYTKQTSGQNNRSLVHKNIIMTLEFT